MALSMQLLINGSKTKIDEIKTEVMQKKTKSLVFFSLSFSLLLNS